MYVGRTFENAREVHSCARVHEITQANNLEVRDKNPACYIFLISTDVNTLPAPLKQPLFSGFTIMLENVDNLSWHWTKRWDQVH